MNFEEKIIERLKRQEKEVERLRVWERPAGGSGVTDHGALTGLSDDDHPQYLLTTGKAADSDKLDGIDSTGFATAGHDHDERYYTETEVDSALALKADKTVTFVAGNGLSGGGDLSANRTFDVSAGLGIDFDVNGAVIVDLTENYAWTGNHSFAQTMYAGSIMPHVSDLYDLGDSAHLWRKIFASELSAVVFAQYEQTLLGGWFTVSKGEGVLPADILSTDTTIDLGADTFEVGDIIVFRGISATNTPQVEYIKIASDLSGTLYGVTRNLDGTGANNWQTGTVFANYGRLGDGRIELNAYDSPRISVFSHADTIAGFREQVRIGDLINGWGYSASTYGGAFGSYESGKANITIDPTNGIRIRNYDQTVIQLTGTEASFENVIKLGTSGRLQQGTGVWGTNFTGSAIWNESGVMNIGGWNNNVKQWWGGSDGKLYAGGGDVIIDDIGISIVNPSLGIGDRPFRFIDSNNNQYFSISGASILGHTEGTMILENPPEEPLNSYTEFSIIAKNTVNVTSFSRLDLQAFDDGGKIINTNANFSAPNIMVSQNLVVEGTIKDGDGVAYLKSNAKAADSDKLDGLDSTDFGRPVFLASPLTSTAWDGDSFSTTAKTKIDLSVVFGVPAGIKAVLVRLAARDSGSSAGYCQFGLSPNATFDSVAAQAYLQGIQNDVYVSVNGIVPCDENGDVYYQIVASGTGTLDAFIEIWGYWL